MNIVEYAGLTQEAATLLERLRVSPSESKSDIIVRALGEAQRLTLDSKKYLNLGQGAQLVVGETLLLFLSEDSKRRRSPEATAEAREDGLYMNGKRVKPSKGSYLQPAMVTVQEKRNPRNENGHLISLSAWRQWHVERDGKIIPVLDLKDPKLARKRARITLRSNHTSAEAAARLLELRKGNFLPEGETLKDLINFGRA